MNYIIVPLECIRRQWQNSLQDTLHASDFIYDMCSVAILHKIEKKIVRQLIYIYSLKRLEHLSATSGLWKER